MNKKTGLTLIEMLIVVAIINILSPVMMQMTMLFIRRQPVHISAGFEQIEARFFLQNLRRNYFLAQQADIDDNMVLLQTFQGDRFRYGLSREGYLFIKQNDREVYRVNGIDVFEVTPENGLFRVTIHTTEIPDRGRRKKQYNLLLPPKGGLNE